MDHAAVLEALPHGIVVLDAHGRATEWNAAALAMLDRTPLTLAGARPPFAGPAAVQSEGGAPVPELRPAMLAALARKRRTMVVRRDERVVEMAFAPVAPHGAEESDADAVGAVACTLVDVTARAEREHALAAAGARRRASAA
ncbi:MAG TPA: PAS domain-containing protein [Solirubrobacteraceae bacterium]|nr:PAS domain-containing protein [Solirubrobacteraceae bacterium]